MRELHSRTHRLATIASAMFAVLGLTTTASADVETMTTATPTIIGGQVIGAGHFALGASSGYPGIRGHVVFGLGKNFDLAIEPEFTYGNGWLSGLNQGVGINLEVPMRLQLVDSGRVAVALRIVPYARVGRAAPAYGFGGTIGARLSIPLPKLFSIVAGIETRGGLGGFSYRGCSAGGGVDCSDNFFEGATYGVIGLETFFRERWYFFAEHEIGAAYNSGGGYYYGGGRTCIDVDGNPYACGSSARAFFNAHVGFAYQMH